MTATNDVVLETITAQLLSPEIVQAAVSRAMEQLDHLPAKDDEVELVRAELADVETEIGRLTEAVAGGANVASMVQAIKDRERRRKSLAGRLAALEAVSQWPNRDQNEMSKDLEKRLADWRGLFGRHVGQTRQLLRKLLVGRLTVTPDVREDGRYARITGTGTLEPLVRGLCPSMVASPTGIETQGSLEFFRRFRAA